MKYSRGNIYEHHRKLKLQSFLNENYMTVSQYLMLTLGDEGMKNLAVIYHNPVCG